MIADPSVLLRRLNPYCAKSLEAAAGLCQTRAHTEITLEHWLLKLLEQGSGDITIISRHYQLDMDKIWTGLLNYLDALPHTINTKPSLSPSLIAVMQSAWLKASLENHEEVIRSVHILQALQEMPHCLKAQDAWQLLSLSPVSLQKMRLQLDETSDENPANQYSYQSDTAITATDSFGIDSTANSTIAANKTQKNDANDATNNNDKQIAQQKHHQAALERFTENVTEKAKSGKIDPVFGRDSEIRQMVDILSRRRKNNPILVGEPGVGKTALVEGLALRIAEGNVPKNLADVSILTLDLGLLQAGAGVKGEFEQRLKNVIDAVQQSPTPILLFIDEAHTIIGAGNSAGGADAANLLKPALARGELRTIAATTWSEYKQYFEKDAALERRFQMVKVDEPDDDRACLMLRGLKSRYAKHHGVHILDEAVKTAVSLSRRYISGRQLPDKAVDLLDTASARVRMGLDTIPESITQLEAKIASLKIEQDAINADLALGENLTSDRLKEIDIQLAKLQDKLTIQQTQFEKEKKQIETLIELRQKLTNKSDSKLLKKLSDAQQELNELQGHNPLLSLDVDSRTVSSVISDWTGVPLESLLKDEQSHLLALEDDLRQRVVGQDNALFELAKRIRAAKTGLTSEDAPMGVFLLVGPSGVGKTETALALADTLFGGEQSLVTINMSEYQEAHTVSQLKGSPPGYVGYGQGGVLTEAVRKRPYSVVLLDEVEKAHRDVLNLFYQVFDRGFMRDGEGREIDFRNTLILMTSNLGSDELMALFEEMPDADIATQQELLRPIIREHFQPALLARFQTVIYTPLGKDALRKIVEMKLNKVASRLQKHYKIVFNVGEKLYDTLVSACLLPDTGARNIDSILNQQILPVVSNLLLQRSSTTNNQVPTLILDFDESEGIVLEWESEQTKAKSAKAKTTKADSDEPKPTKAKVVKSAKTKPAEESKGKKKAVKKA
ncbi:MULTISPECIES: type VI secretion system ATPase TssH [unclassified Gilliamella]|uniref:type VI secretion system ATPase TssH n=1 Tax=unclassified Gilliamella TaxID=2685620 RepID=UPI002269FB67|nr:MULTISPECIES: type VI secretion system ATPase TssH [unclassified Gilliamella]MCX8574725.1 type VI secretion system ATPase TssH [Gilliamella sp. B3831]MCX8576921.1 type VI secretion system ATPase TssH [Gilliamella sp. B3815]MCX8590449.1 type VI secretion system ATPase TssH [Gilliamella sp. B3812]MCX8604057.1 type VI secretion system ATPase TssH [Gilliamella sp. B3823]MCX8605788.1 type VI secretion system ATPase TssH [Gilliamella sp. B3825]